MLLTFGKTLAKTSSLPPVPPFSSCMHASTAPPWQVSTAFEALKSSGIWPSRDLTCSHAGNLRSYLIWRLDC